MFCKNHLEREASFVCSGCGSTICLNCTVQLNNKPYCKECLERYIEQRPVIEQKVVVGKRKSRFLTFCFSFIPGAAHMYLGLIRKGLSLMFIFFLGLFISIISSGITGLNWLDGFLIPAVSIVCGCYSLFDSLASAREINSGRFVDDTSLFSYDELFDKIRYNKVLFGGILVLIGLLSILNKFSSFINGVANRLFGVDFSLTGLLMPFLLLALGFYLIRRREGL